LNLKALTPDHVRKLYREKLDGGLAPRTVLHIHRTLSKALKQAHDDGLIPRNAAASVKAPQPRRQEIRPLSRGQVRTLLEAAGEAGDRLEALYVVAVTAGLRRGELLGLKWEDVDLDAGMLQVRRTLSEPKGGCVFEAPKSGKGRSVRLTQRATAALREHRKRQLEERMRLGTLWQEHGLIFPSGVGTPLLGGNLHRAFKATLRRAELPAVRFHDLRHTCATLLLRQSVNPKFVQELLGHADISLTLNVCSHVLPDMGDTAAGAMDAALG
jgi:integrase